MDLIGGFTPGKVDFCQQSCPLNLGGVADIAEPDDHPETAGVTFERLVNAMLPFVQTRSF